MSDQLIRLLAVHISLIVALSQIVEMIREYLQVSHSTRGETEELERLASQLTLSETPKQVCTTNFQSIHQLQYSNLANPWSNLEAVGRLCLI